MDYFALKNIVTVIHELFVVTALRLLNFVLIFSAFCFVSGYGFHEHGLKVIINKKIKKKECYKHHNFLFL